MLGSAADTEEVVQDTRLRWDGDRGRHPGWRARPARVPRPNRRPQRARAAAVQRSAARLPQFVDQGRGQAALQMLVFGLVFWLIALMSDSVWGMAAATARDWFARSPQRLAVVGGAGGLAMIGLGMGVAVSGRKD
jgi:hypothetical protein